MKLKLFLAFAIFCLSIQALSGQTVASVVKKGNGAKITPEVKEEAVKLLRETIVEINNLRTLENRISLLAEMASLTWAHDEQEGRQMFRSVINDFTQLLARYDAQLNNFGTSSDDEDIYAAYGKGAKAETLRKMMKALGVRQQITKAIANHDPRYALEFYEATAQSISNPGIRKQIAQTDTYFLSGLLAQVAESDAAIALEYGRKSVAKGINYGTINLLSKLYEKDAEKGAALGEDIVGKFKSGEETEEYVKISLLNIGEESLRQIKENKGKTPILSEQSLRDIADLLGQQILAREEVESMEVSEILPLLEKYAPSRAIQIRAKFKINKQQSAEVQERVAQIKKDFADVEAAEIKNGKSPQANLAESMEKIAAGELSAEEREKVIKQMREIIASLDNRSEKIIMLSGLAVQVAGLGDKELASDIMREASGLVSPQPVNYQEYMEIWMLSGGYAGVDSDKAFSTLENAVFRLNETIAAFIKVGEFMDTGGEIIEDGEVQMNGFGGNIAQEMLGGLGAIAQPTIRQLAVEDFARTKGLANKFDRAEVRILAKTMILQSVLSENKSAVVIHKAMSR